MSFWWSRTWLRFLHPSRRELLRVRLGILLLSAYRFRQYIIWNLQIRRTGLRLDRVSLFLPCTFQCRFPWVWSLLPSPTWVLNHRHIWLGMVFPFRHQTYMKHILQLGHQFSSKIGEQTKLSRPCILCPWYHMLQRILQNIKYVSHQFYKCNVYQKIHQLLRKPSMNHIVVDHEWLGQHILAIQDVNQIQLEDQHELALEQLAWQSWHTWGRVEWASFWILLKSCLWIVQEYLESKWVLDIDELFQHRRVSTVVSTMKAQWTLGVEIWDTV